MSLILTQDSFFNILPFHPEPPDLLQRTGRTLVNNHKLSHDTPPEGKIPSRSDHRTLRSAKIQKPLLSPPLQDLLPVPIVICPGVLPVPEDLVFTPDLPESISKLHRPPPAGRPGDTRCLSRSGHRSGFAGPNTARTSGEDILS